MDLKHLIKYDGPSEKSNSQNTATKRQHIFEIQIRFQISNLMAFRDFQLCEDGTKNDINVFEHIMLSLNSTFFGVHPDVIDKEIQSHSSL
jgi:hypothetical protein